MVAFALPIYKTVFASQHRQQESEGNKMAMIKEDVLIVGAGIAGLAIAVALKRVGLRALVLERADELRTTGTALSLFPDAWIALDALGVADKLIPHYATLAKNCITNVSTGAVQEIYFAGPAGNGDGPRAVHRKVLLEVLVDELPRNAIRFSSKVNSIETQKVGDSDIPIVCLEDGTIIKAKVLIGCDGVHSVVARWLGLAEPVNSGRSAFRGLAVFPEGHGLAKNEVQQFVDAGKRAAAVPLNDKEIYWFLTTNYIIEGVDKIRDPKQYQELIQKHTKGFPPLFMEVVQRADLSSITWAPFMFRYPWKVLSGNLSRGCITVAGDAMHPMTPDLGHGGCAALEDAVVLGRKIGELFLRKKSLSEGDIVPVLEEYVKERRFRAAGLITGSYISGWIQQGGNTWMAQFLKYVFYKFIFAILNRSIHYDCGKLPTADSSNAQGSSMKTD